MAETKTIAGITTILLLMTSGAYIYFDELTSKDFPVVTEYFYNPNGDDGKNTLVEWTAKVYTSNTTFKEETGIAVFQGNNYEEEIVKKNIKTIIEKELLNRGYDIKGFVTEAKDYDNRKTISVSTTYSTKDIIK